MERIYIKGTPQTLTFRGSYPKLHLLDPQLNMMIDHSEK